MGKRLSLGSGLPYPITILRRLKAVGDAVAKKEHILEYEYRTMQRLYDRWGEPYERERTRLAQWDCPVEGTLTRWLVEAGAVCARPAAFVEIDEACAHDVQFSGLCVLCGQDMTRVTWASPDVDAERAPINMIHDATNLKVSQDEAQKAEGELQRRLLRQRRLTLVVDLDQTIIHACIEPTVGEWQRDPANPNHAALRDVRAFQLKDEGPRGLASECWYYIKLRPGLPAFLEAVAELYELHVYTMGTRAYAASIARLVDPDKRLFGDRIISRDENGSMTAKNLARLFPVDTKMVCIIDDRADVWPSNRPNLIKVVPYDFFKGIGDINSSFLPKREEIPKAPPPVKKKANGENGDKAPAGEGAVPSAAAPEQVPAKSPTSADADPDAKVSALEELVKMGGGDDQARHSEQVAEQEKTLEKQLLERPLLHRQEELDKEEVDEEETQEETLLPSDKPASSQGHPKHSVLHDDDDELHYLQQHLTKLHASFYKEYDSKSRLHGKAIPGRVAQLKGADPKPLSIDVDGASTDVPIPDVGVVMPRLKSRILRGTHILLSGMVPIGYDVKRSEIALQAMSFGAAIHSRVSRKLTHVVAPTSKSITHKVRQAAKFPHVKLVNQLWLIDSMSRWKAQDEGDYAIEVKATTRRPSATPSLGTTDDESHYESSGPSQYTDTETDGQETDYDDLIPHLDPLHSPIEDLKTFDWNAADDEVEAFLNETDDDDDDDGGGDGDTDPGGGTAESQGSRGDDAALPQTTGDRRPGKRKSSQSHSKGSDHSRSGNASDSSDADDGGSADQPGRATKRARTLKSGGTNGGGGGAGLPTPGITDDGDEAGLMTDGEGGAGTDLDLERELEAELEREWME